MKRLVVISILLLSFLAANAQCKEVKIKLVQTSDIHGNFFPYDFIGKRQWDGSLARVYSFVQEKRKIYKDNLILIDNGDILQGQPTVYYYNFVDTASTHLAADIMNYMRYDIGNMGNHDIETGPVIYNRWIKDCNFPILGANIMKVSDGNTFLKPYEIIERDGVKIAFLGMITPAVPVWLPESLWKGLRFDDMEESARKWIKIIKEEEHPDFIVGVFHSGKDTIKLAGKYNENYSLEIARNVPGLDVVMMGHDHLPYSSKVVNVVGDSVLVVNPGSNGKVVANVDVQFIVENGKVKAKEVKGVLSAVKKYGISEEFMGKFASQYNLVKSFVSKKVGTFTECLSTEPAYFGPSAFVDLIHSLQLKLTGADISFTAPLSFDAQIPKGDITMADMFNLYKYENSLCVIKLSGKEIKNYLEMSYAIWTNQMTHPEDHLLLLKKDTDGDERSSFVNYSFNFDSAAGIIYTVDVTKPAGEKINIIRMADGKAFDEKQMYKIALNSYRANGGGELLTKGAGIPQDELYSRIINISDKDLRYYLTEYIQQHRVLSPQPLNQWKFIPEDMVKPAAERDYNLLFGKNKMKRECSTNIIKR